MQRACDEFRGILLRGRGGGKKTFRKFRDRGRTLPRHAPGESGVGEGFIESAAVSQLARFENLAAIETFDVLRLIVFGDDLRSFVRATGNWG